MLAIDHFALKVPSPEASALFLADLLGGLPVSKDGPEDEFFRVNLGNGSFLLYEAAREVPPQHLAFQVDAAAFDQLVTRLEADSRAFGNDPECPPNGRWEDELGEHGRVYFTDPAGHLFEVVGKRAE